MPAPYRAAAARDTPAGSTSPATRRRSWKPRPPPWACSPCHFRRSLPGPGDISLELFDGIRHRTARAIYLRGQVEIDESDMESKPTAADEVSKSDVEWQETLSPQEYRVLRQRGTEPAWSHPFNAVSYT